MVATEVLGLSSQIAPGSPWAPDEGQWEFDQFLARGSGIRAGTTEILRNILGERVLGLPKGLTSAARGRYEDGATPRAGLPGGARHDCRDPCSAPRGRARPPSRAGTGGG